MGLRLERRMRFSLGAAIAATILFCADSPALAEMKLRLTQGATQETIADGGAGDINGNDGAITFLGSVGSFDLNVTTGLSKPFRGGADDPLLDLNSINTTSGEAGVLTIELTDTGFTGSPMGLNPIAFLTSIGGGTDGTVTIETFAGVGEFDQQVLLSTMTFDGNAFSGADPSENFNTSDLSGIDPDNPEYSLTVKITITHDADSSSSMNATLKALPEPSAVLVWGGIAACAFSLGFTRTRVASGSRPL